MIVMKKLVSYILLLTALLGCNTGIESTKKITEKDVKKALAQVGQSTSRPFLTINDDSVATWHVGKQFFVTDDQVKLIFNRSTQYNIDSLLLAGKSLIYQGYSIDNKIDNTQNVVLNFSLDNLSFCYSTGKPLDKLSPRFTMPFLIDKDLVSRVNSQLQGKEFYIKTHIWYDLTTQEMLDGKQYVKVKVDSVLPGNKVLPLRVIFTDGASGLRAFVWMAAGASTLMSRDFTSLFSLHDLHNDYPAITPENWAHIERCEIVDEMTKEECKLAKGTPKSISQQPDQSGLREYWYYDDGTYLFFQDGKLKSFKR